MKTLSWSALKDQLIAFFEHPQSPRPLGFLRIVVSSLCIIQALLWLPDWEAFVGEFGWIQWEITQALSNPWQIRMQHVSEFLTGFGISQEAAPYVFLWTYIGTLAFLTAGLLTRIAAIFVWLMHSIVLASIPTFFYGLDIFIHISLFYLMLFPVSKAYSIDVALKWVSSEPTWGVGMSLRVLQIHMCFVYLSAALGKIQNVDWWNGNTIWHSMVHPFFSTWDMTWLASFAFIPMFLGWWTLFIEFFYFGAMWIPKIRVFWLFNVVALHLGIGIFLNLWLFASIMILLSLSAFGHLCLEDIKQWMRKQVKGTCPERRTNGKRQTVSSGTGA